MKCKEGLTVLCLSFKALPNNHFRCMGDVSEMDQECILRNIFCMQVENLRIARKEEAALISFPFEGLAEFPDRIEGQREILTIFENHGVRSSAALPCQQSRPNTYCRVYPSSLPETRCSINILGIGMIGYRNLYRDGSDPIGMLDCRLP